MEKNNHVLVKDGTLKILDNLRRKAQKSNPHRVTNDHIIRAALEVYLKKEEK